MSEKIKLPKDVVEAIEGIKKHADEMLLYNLQYMHDVCENEKWDAPKFHPIYNWIKQNGHFEYFKALVNGYEVELTPEDRATKWLISLDCVRGKSERDIVMKIKAILEKG